MCRHFIILSLIIIAGLFSAVMVSCSETDPNAYLRSLRRIGMVAIDPVDSASLSDVEKFLAMDVQFKDERSHFGAQEREGAGRNELCVQYFETRWQGFDL